jgi:hypothetical protein
VGVKVWEMPGGLGGPGHKVWILPRGLSGLGHKVRVLPRGLGGPVGRKSKSTRALQGFGSAFWALGGSGVLSQVNLRLRIYGYVDIWISR